MHKFFLLFVCLFCVSGCVSTKQSYHGKAVYPIASVETQNTRDTITQIQPNELMPVENYVLSQAHYAPSYKAASHQAASLQSIEPAAGDAAMQVNKNYKRVHSFYEMSDYTTYKSKGHLAAVKNSLNAVPKNCRVKDRFDRKDVVAYQWGRDDENRMGFDVDGIGFDSMHVEQVKLTYSLRLQPEKRKKERCRYRSAFQGLAGSGYNEFFVRENDTVMDRASDWTDRIQN